ncbi:hypothetical protein F7P69_23495 [Cellulosimicrobium funkei]|nr:hypothetical protein [Cellulosimicrobium funkei]
MNDQQILWLVIGVVVLLLVIAVAVVLGNRRRARRKEADRHAAEQLRGDASRQEERLRAEEQEAAAVRGEAESAEEEARRLRAEAEERERRTGGSRSALDAQIREADRLDPDVATDRSGHRRDGASPATEGQAAQTRAAGHDARGAGAAADGPEVPGKHAADAPLDGGADGADEGRGRA